MKQKIVDRELGAICNQVVSLQERVQELEAQIERMKEASDAKTI